MSKYGVLQFSGKRLQTRLGFFRAWTETLRQRRARRAIARELNALDERSLKDIGLARGDIEAVAAGTHWRTYSQSTEKGERKI